MSAQMVLLDMIAENMKYVNWVLDEISPDLLHWKPDPGALTIAVTLWHCARALDVFKTLHIDNLADKEEIWIKNGWAEKTGYDPRGVGTYGWGQITGYTTEEVAAIPQMNKDVLKNYTDEVMNCLRDYIENVSEEELFDQAPGFEGKQTNYFWLRHPLMDMTRHLGEVLAFKEMWERQTREER